MFTEDSALTKVQEAATFHAQATVRGVVVVGKEAGGNVEGFWDLVKRGKDEVLDFITFEPKVKIPSY